METTRLRSIDFNFDLPKDRIAQRPRPYEEQKLLLYDTERKLVSHHMFQSLPALLRPGDLLVANDTHVVPAALRQSKEVFILFTDISVPSLLDVKAICPSQPRVGDIIDFPHAQAKFIVKRKEPLWDVYIGDVRTEEEYDSLLEFLCARGSHPIPNYVLRNPDAQDITDYQTMFASHSGSIACPVAGLHFNADLLQRVQAAGVEFATVTLHVGYGTFRRFKHEFVDEHVADLESYAVTASALKTIGQALSESRRVIAIGSTVARLLESIRGELDSYREIDQDLFGQTDIFIHPPYRFKTISGLITNLPYPRIPVMSMAAAFTGLDELMRIIDAALEHDYLFYSYGDAILALSQEVR